MSARWLGLILVPVMVFVGWLLYGLAFQSVDTQIACGLNPEQIGVFQTVPAGAYVKGASPVYREEYPTIRVQVGRFEIQIHEVTNDQFAAFVSETGYVTDAERRDSLGRLAGSSVFRFGQANSAQKLPWELVRGATWRHPEGPGSNIDQRRNHPVVHVSQKDASAYASWAGGRLPNEVEWEYMATRGLHNPAVSTSGAYDSAGAPVANTWQGVFPFFNENTDRFAGAAPVGCFQADRSGLYDMIGNVWEWTSTPYDRGTHTIKGGSFLCAMNYCRRYRPAARQPQETHFSSNHIGFRIVRDVSQ